ncbi:MAG: hypothetical protein AB1449_02910 [Chloroflexota bacterium]
MIQWKKLWERAAALGLAGLMVACNLPAAAPQPLSEGARSPCSRQVELPLAVESAGQAPMLIGEGPEARLDLLGRDGAEARAAALLAGENVCTGQLSPATQQALNEAERMLQNGQLEEAQAYMNDVLSGLRSGAFRVPMPGRLRSLGAAGAEAVGAALQWAEMLVRYGYEEAGQQALDEAIQTFREFAEAKLEQASLEEALRLAEEAQLLGQDDIAECALDRARQIAKERLEAALADVDPCLPNPQVLEQAARNLLNALADAMLLGVQEASGVGAPLYEAASAKAQAAVGGLIAAATGVPNPECPGYAIGFEYTASTGVATLTGGAHSCSGLAGPWEGEVGLQFNAGEMQFGGSGPWQFTLAEGQLRTSGQVMFAGGGAGGSCVITQVSDPLQFEISFSADGGMASIRMGSTGGGTITFVCPDNFGATIPFAAAWAAETFEVPVTRYTECH